MREYKIKRGYNPDINKLVEEYFNVSGEITEGIEFTLDGFGEVSMRQDKKLLIIDTTPPAKPSGDPEVIRKWNGFLLAATGKDGKARRKDYSKMK